MIKTLSKNAVIGYPAGVITGITYGLNPLFAVPLMKDGASIESILFFRYAIAVLLLGAFLLLRRHSFRVTWKQACVLLVLGLLYTTSSLTLFEAYNQQPYLVRGIQVHRFGAGHDHRLPLSSPGGHYHGFSESSPLVASMALHRPDVRGGGHHDAERFVADGQPDRPPTLLRFGFGVCVVHRYH